jgi:hypothetical protein
MTDLARYCGVQSNTLSMNVTRSKLYREFLSRSAQEAQQQNSGSLPIPCLPAILIIGDGAAPDVKPLADYFSEHGPDYIPEHGPVDAAAVAWSPIPSDATDDLSAQSGVADGVADTVPDKDFVLPERLIQALEFGIKPTDMSMIHLIKSSRAVDATELQSESSLVLGYFPQGHNEADRAAARIALREQGHYFVDGSRLAEKAANSKDLKTVMPCPLWYDLFFPFLCVADSELDSRLEKFEDEIFGDNDVDTDLTEVQTQPSAAGGIGENDVELDAPASAATAVGEEWRRLRPRPFKQVDSPQKKLSHALARDRRRWQQQLDF